MLACSDEVTGGIAPDSNVMRPDADKLHQQAIGARYKHQVVNEPPTATDFSDTLMAHFTTH
jgi:hypothetical protein